MFTPNEQYKQFGQQPFYYVNGLQISNDATTPNTKLDVGVGTCIDSTATYQIGLTSSVVINAANNGLNGLDTGSLGANKVYAVYLVADPVQNQASGCIISLSLTGPLMPFGYSAFALIGYVITDGSSNFLKGYWTSGNGSQRIFLYDAPQATAVTAGASTTYAAVDLSKFVPAIDGTLSYIATAFTPNAANDTLKMQGANATGDQIVINGQVASVALNSYSQVLAQLVVGVPKINYKVSAGTDAVAINVAGFVYWI